MDSTLQETWQSNNWENLSLITYTYNADGTIQRSLVQFWAVTIWTNYSRTTFT